jgi:hypothetical protein
MEAFKNSEIVSITLWIFTTFGGILAFFLVKTLKEIDHNQSLLSDTLKEGLKEAFSRISSLEKDNERIKVFHHINHGQEL